MKNIRLVASLIGIGLLIASVAKELRQPPAERAWHGMVAGFFPYDLRVPTVARIRAALWNPDNPSVLVPKAFGVGWSVNLAALAAVARSVR